MERKRLRDLLKAVIHIDIGFEFEIIMKKVWFFYTLVKCSGLPSDKSSMVKIIFPCQI